MLSLAGTWVLKYGGSDHIDGIEKMKGVPLCALLLNRFPGESISIYQLSEGLIEEVKFTLRTKTGYKQFHFQLCKLNFAEDVLSTIVGVDREFTELSILRMGPAKNQRSLEQYILDRNGREIRVEIDIDDRDFGRQRMVKFLDRKEEPLPSTVIFRSATGSHSWSNLSTHNAAALQSLKINILSTFSRKINISELPSLDITDSGIAANVPETRRFDEWVTPDEEVTYFIIQVLEKEEKM